MSELVRAAYQSAVAITLVGMALFGQLTEAVDVPASEWITAGAGFVGLVAIGQMVRAIAKTDSQKTDVIETLQKQLKAVHEENRLLREEIHGMLNATKQEED